jgi:predicted transcriptional regulator
MHDITEILVHWQSGRPVSEISRSLGVDPKTVRKYAAVADGLGYQPGQASLLSQE